MKKKFFVIATVAATVFMSCSKETIQEPQANAAEEIATARGGGSLVNTLSKGLVGRFEFDGNLNDMTQQLAPGSSYIGKPVYATDRKGVRSSAINFDGTFGVNLAGVPLDSNSSVSFWMRSGTTITDYYIGFVEGQRSFSFLQRENNKFQGAFFSTGTPTYIVSNPLFNTWHHMAATRDNQTYKFYIDGKLVGSRSADPVDTVLSVHEFWLGWTYNSGVKFWKGQLDDLRIYGRVLNSSEVATLATY